MRRNLMGWLPVVLCVLPLMIVGLGFFDLPAAYAQGQGEKAGAVKAAAPAKTDAAPKAGKAADPDAAVEDFLKKEKTEPAKSPAAKQASGAKTAADESPIVTESMLSLTFRSLGIFYTVVFLGLSITFVALFVMNVLILRRENMLPSAFIEQFEEHLDQKQYQEAYELSKANESYLARVLSAGLSKISKGYDESIEAMQEVGEDENMKLEHRLSYIALIGTISPMVGLLGTVQGMIASFQVIAASSTQPKPSALADGICTALFTTLVGLFIAIPAIGVFNVLRNRVARLVLEVGIVSEGMMGRFANVGKKKD